MSLLGGKCETPADRRSDPPPSPPRAVLTYLSVTQWFADPSIGIVVYQRSALGIAFGVTAISTGLRNRRALYASLIVALHRHRAVLPDDQLHPQRHDAVVLPAPGGARRRRRAALIGWLHGRRRTARPWCAPTAIVGFLVAGAHRARQVHVVLGGLRELEPRPRTADRHRRAHPRRASAATSGSRASTCSPTCCCRRSRSS